MPRRYRYCLDPVFLGTFVLYVLNKTLFKPLAQGHTTFFAYYFNDLICIPFCLPPWLCVYRVIGIRGHDRFPTRFEVLSHLIIWSIFFEGIAPILKGPFAWTVGDPWDVVAYAVGAALIGVYWGLWRRSSRSASKSPQQSPKEAAL